MQIMIKLAKTAGFCFGVDRAVNLVYELVEKGEKVCTLGPIIHNSQLVADLASKGVKIINDISECPDGYTVVIRTHGVEKTVIDCAGDSNVDYIDATCPFVSKIHRIVSEQRREQLPLLQVTKIIPRLWVFALIAVVRALCLKMTKNLTLY